MTPLQEAVRAGYSETTDLLLALGASAMATVPVSGTSASLLLGLTAAFKFRPSH